VAERRRYQRDRSSGSLHGSTTIIRPIGGPRHGLDTP
jgi:hypothetical protein